MLSTPVNTLHVWVALGKSGGRYRSKCSLCGKHSRQQPPKAPAQECIELVRRAACLYGVRAAFAWVDSQTDLPGLQQHENPLEGLRQWIGLTSWDDGTLGRIVDKALDDLKNKPYFKTLPK